MYVIEVSTANCCILCAHQVTHATITSKIPFFRMNNFCTPINEESITYDLDMLLKTVGGTQSNAAFITCHSEIIIVARK